MTVRAARSFRVRFLDVTADPSRVPEGAAIVTKHADGPIALQYGAGTVKFRNVRIRQL